MTHPATEPADIADTSGYKQATPEALHDAICRLSILRFESIEDSRAIGAKGRLKAITGCNPGWSTTIEGADTKAGSSNTLFRASYYTYVNGGASPRLRHSGSIPAASTHIVLDICGGQEFLFELKGSGNPLNLSNWRQTAIISDGFLSMAWPDNVIRRTPDGPSLAAKMEQFIDGYVLGKGMMPVRHMARSLLTAIVPPVKPTTNETKKATLLGRRFPR